MSLIFAKHSRDVRATRELALVSKLFGLVRPEVAVAPQVRLKPQLNVNFPYKTNEKNNSILWTQHSCLPLMIWPSAALSNSRPPAWITSSPFVDQPEESPQPPALQTRRISRVSTSMPDTSAQYTVNVVMKVFCSVRAHRYLLIDYCGVQCFLLAEVLRAWQQTPKHFLKQEPCQWPTDVHTLSNVFLVVHVEQRAVLLALLHVLDVEQELLVEDVVAQRA